jgi:hypothetical protein
VGLFKAGDQVLVLMQRMIMYVSTKPKNLIEWAGPKASQILGGPWVGCGFCQALPIPYRIGSLSIKLLIVWPVPLAEVWTLNNFSFDFVGFLLNFQWQRLLKNQLLPHLRSKSYKTTSIKSSSSRAFQEYQECATISLIFLVLSF